MAGISSEARTIATLIIFYSELSNPLNKVYFKLIQFIAIQSPIILRQCGCGGGHSECHDNIFNYVEDII